MTIRTRTPADLPELVALARSVHRVDGYPPYMPNDDFAGFLQSSEALGAWVATRGGTVVGHVSLHRGSSPGVLDLAAAELGVEPTDCGVIARLLVGAAERRSGLGRRLLDHAAEQCVRRGLAPVLDVVDRFGPAIALYEKAGWTRLGSVDVGLPDGSTMTEIVFSAPRAAAHSGTT